MPPYLIVLIGLSLLFAFLNGVHDSSNLVATMISSRALTPRIALTLAAIAEFCGPFIFGVAVAKTIGSEIVASDHLTIEVILAALLSAILWNVLTWLLGIPSSSSHALIGGIIGASILGVGLHEIHLAGVLKVILYLFLSPLIGFLAGLLIANITYAAAWNSTPKVNWLFKRLQVATSLGLAMGSGANDAQKTMGLITLGLVISKVQTSFEVPFWVILSCALAISLGVAFGGNKLIRTLGSKFFKIRPVHGFASQAASALVILTASLLGGPVSATQIVSSSIMGVGAADRKSMVRWGVAGEIISAWFLTIPVTGFLAAGIYWLLSTGIPKLASFF